MSDENNTQLPSLDTIRQEMDTIILEKRLKEAHPKVPGGRLVRSSDEDIIKSVQIVGDTARILMLDNSALTFTQALMSLFSSNKYSKGKWGRETNGPYFTAEAATKLKPILDHMASISPRVDRVINAERFGGCTANTLSSFICQAWVYLRTNMEVVDDSYPNGKYATLRMQIAAYKAENGVILKWRDKLILPGGNDEPYLGDSLEDTNAVPKFKEDLEQWLIAAVEDSKFIRNKLSLTEDQVQYVVSMIEDVQGVLPMKVSQSQIALTFNLALWKEMNGKTEL
jgi:hypothetical protein